MTQKKNYNIEKLSIAQIQEEQISASLVSELRARASYMDTDKSLNEFLTGTAELLNIITDWEGEVFLNESLRDALTEANQLYKNIHRYNYLQVVKI
jgi:hypothetical protein